VFSVTWVEDGKGRMPDTSCESGQALEKAQNGNGRLLEKVGMDLGLAPCRLGVGATSVWGLAPRRSGIDKSHRAKINEVKKHNMESARANSRRENPTANAISAEPSIGGRQSARTPA
jgi:hypothetical protein